MIDNQTQLLGLIGHPIIQSKSTIMHNKALDDLCLNYRYFAFDVDSSNLEKAIAGIRALNFKGANITIPHKTNVMRYLDEISDEALAIGAVNTIINQNGRLIGYNTDGVGYLRSLLEETGVAFVDKRVLILGTGGAARAISYTIAANEVEEVIIAGRTIQKSSELIDSLAIKQVAKAIAYDQLEDYLKDVDIIINTTSVGMYPNDNQSLINPEWIESKHLVSDIIYNPLETKLLKDARAKGAKIHSGLGMFIYQGAIAFEKWTESLPDIEVMRKTVIEALNDKERKEENKC